MSVSGRSSAAVLVPRVRSSRELTVLVRDEDGGPVLAVEKIAYRDLVDPLAEVWFESHLRRGFTDVPLHDIDAELRPLHVEDELGRPYCAGLRLDALNPAGDLSGHRFPRTCFEPAARRAAQKLIAAGRLAADAAYTYELRADDRGETDAPTILGPAPSGKGPELRLLHLPLAPLLERAELVEDELSAPTTDNYPVFYTRSARELAERCSRKGGEQSPPVETGGVLIGPLCSCPETNEIFAVVTDVLEAADTEATKYSLTFSGTTWMRIQAVLKARAGHPAMRADRILGQCHGHQFLPLDGLPPCEACFERKTCSRTTCWPSRDDSDWMRAVFHGQPWQLAHIFGLNARAENVEGFFGQHGGRLVSRGYRIVDDFDPFETAGGH